jgi:type IV pilus assembly protein PilE
MIRNGSEKQQRGFTLIELMIAVAVLAILAAIAVPGYTEYVRRARRAEARSGLLQAAQWMERAATANGLYPAAANFPPALQTVPSGAYSIALTVPAGQTTFSLKATRQNNQTSDKCGTFTLDNTGQQGIADADTSVTVNECWGR